MWSLTFCLVRLQLLNKLLVHFDHCIRLLFVTKLQYKTLANRLLCCLVCFNQKLMLLKHTHMRYMYAIQSNNEFNKITFNDKFL